MRGVQYVQELCLETVIFVCACVCVCVHMRACACVHVHVFVSFEIISYTQPDVD